MVSIVNFVKDNIVSPILKRIIHGVPFVWSSEAESAREVMVEQLCSYPILRFFDVTQQHGCTLMQAIAVVMPYYDKLMNTVVNTFANNLQGIG